MPVVETTGLYVAYVTALILNGTGSFFVHPFQKKFRVVYRTSQNHPHLYLL